MKIEREPAGEKVFSQSMRRCNRGEYDLGDLTYNTLSVNE